MLQIIVWSRILGRWDVEHYQYDTPCARRALTALAQRDSRGDGAWRQVNNATTLELVFDTIRDTSQTER